MLCFDLERMVLFSLVLCVLCLIALCYSDVVWLRVRCGAVISGGCLLFVFGYWWWFVCFVLFWLLVGLTFVINFAGVGCCVFLVVCDCFGCLISYSELFDYVCGLIAFAGLLWSCCFGLLCWYVCLILGLICLIIVFAFAGLGLIMIYLLTWCFGMNNSVGGTSIFICSDCFMLRCLAWFDFFSWCLVYWLRLRCWFRVWLVLLLFVCFFYVVV